MTAGKFYRVTPTYGPVVLEGEQGLKFEFPVDSGFMSFSKAIPISTADYEVIKSDSQRAVLLYAALHHPFQLRETALSDAEVQDHLRIILHAPLPEAASFLNEKNALSRNAIYNLASSYLKVDPMFR